MANAKKPGTGATNKRRKALAAAKQERQAARRASRDAGRRRRRRIVGGLFALAAALVVVGVVIWPDSPPDDTAAPAASAPPTPSPVDIGCDPLPTPPGEPQTFSTAPKDSLADDVAYTLTLETNCGDIVIATTPAKAPETVNSMLWLAGEGYFDGSPCHRLTTEGLFVLQCGDPTGTGTGGPGYTVPDENLPKDKEKNYPKGTVAMANSGPGTAGSQFFIVYADTTLPAGYTIWGTVTEGLDVVQRVASAGVLGGAGDGTPAASIGIESTAVTPPLG